MFKTRIILTAVILLALVGVLLANMVQRMAHLHQSDAEYLRLFKEVVAITKQSYVEQVDDKKLMTGAINGMLAALDPHSSYMPATSYDEMKVHMAGAFGGLGIQLGTKDGNLMVEAPIEDTPAFRAGILAGDHIWSIDGKPTKGVPINDCVSRMRGTPGTSVTLGILREGSKEPLSFKLVRAIIKTKSVKAKLLEPGYAYLGISEFQERTGEDFERALKTLAADNGGPLKGLVLDLRYNPGGLLDQAIRVTNSFVGEGLNDGLIVSTKGRSAGSEREMTANIGDKQPHYPIVVLINGASASASEIVAGALQDHKRAVIMGTQSFGKGSVQSVITLRNGDGLKLTTARYYTPSGRSIQAKGITPDITVEFAKKPAQPEKKKMPEIREQDLDGHMQQVGAPKDAPAASEPSAAPMDPKEQELLGKDNQLARALDLLKGVNLLKAGLK
ncbi:peptidase S41 [Geomonas silvestris]|uniref:Peptidase S41 n=1 Tax=Geomonas silvestris TaxID=2740184 RepID=A0A6V8MH77_9BACT|nr:S41 family peptidase [Geomonas silvestris]GFO59317.1 peptidase S41 [Geomonas silvestris]